MSFDAKPFNMFFGLGTWALVVGVVVGLALVVLLLTSLFSFGIGGPGRVFRQIGEAVRDWTGMSFRRVVALTRLTFLESMRRKTFTVGVIFVLLIMFAGWFMGDTTEHPDMQVKRYVSFVLTAISWLIIPVVLLLSCWGLPEDIRARTLHTVVTKPVRRSEVVLGRVLGFALIGTVALLIMGGVGYVWIERQVTSDARHMLIARVPVYGELSWIDREGNDARSGVNVGDLWSYRSFIDGNTRARAIWDFEGLDENSFRKNPETGELELHLESNFNVFRTHKGNIEAGVRGRYTFVKRNEEGTEDVLRVPYATFTVKEFRSGANVEIVPRKLTYERTKTADLLDDLISDGKLRIEVECLSSGQFLGMARPDLFIRLPERSFATSFCKAMFGVWMMMATTVVLCVTFSCLAKGPVATLAAGVFLVIGRSFTGFMTSLAQGDLKGSGTIESIIRIHRHLNPQVPMEEGAGLSVVQVLDMISNSWVWVGTYMIPDFSKFDLTEYVANGFDVPFSSALLPAMATAVGYSLPMIIFAYFFLKYRELESK